MDDRLFSALSLCRKANRLRMGMDCVTVEVQSGTAALVLLSSDVSPRSERQIKEVCTRRRVPARKLPYTMVELAFLVKKPYGILAVCDKGFAEMIAKHLPPEPEPDPEAEPAPEVKQ